MSNITLTQSMMRTCVQVKERTSSSLPPRFLPSRLGRDFETGSPRPTSPHLLRCALRAAPGQDARARVSPSLGDAHAQGKPPSIPSLTLPPSPLFTFTPFSQWLGFAMRQRAQLAAGAASQGGGFPLAWPPATVAVGAKAPLARRECTAIR